MSKPQAPREGWAKVSLGLSLLFGVGVFVYFALNDALLNGAALGVLVVIAGVWEYRRKRQDKRTVERYEAEAEEQRQKNRR